MRQGLHSTQAVLSTAYHFDSSSFLGRFWHILIRPKPHFACGIFPNVAFFPYNQFHRKKYKYWDLTVSLMIMSRNFPPSVNSKIHKHLQNMSQLNLIHNFTLLFPSIIIIITTIRLQIYRYISYPFDIITVYISYSPIHVKYSVHVIKLKLCLYRPKQALRALNLRVTQYLDSAWRW
jgi:hypothetical protein